MVVRHSTSRGPTVTSAGIALFVTAASLTAQVNWVERSPLTSPPGRFGAAFAHDSLRGRSVIFGGQQALNAAAFDTWEWDGSEWTQRSPSNVPGGRRRPAMAFDSARGVCVMFGGYSGSFDYGDTWEWNGSDWTQRFLTPSPQVRDTSSMAYDSGRAVIVMFGGGVSAGPLNDTWEYDGVAWTQRLPATSPGARFGHAMAYDAARGVVVMFGGYPGGSYVNDTWEWDGTNWSLRSPATRPSSRANHTLAYDAARSRVVLCGGLVSGGTPIGDVWEYDGATWTQRTPAIALPPRYQHTFVYEDARRLCMAFSARVSGENDTWEYGPIDVASCVTYGLGCAGSNGTPVLGSTDLGPFVGDVFTTTVATLPTDPGVIVAGLLGFSDTSWGAITLPADLSPYDMPGCTLYNDVGWPMPLPVAGGIATWDLPIPVMPSLLGLPFFEQALVFDAPANPAGMILSNPLRARIGGR